MYLDSSAGKSDVFEKSLRYVVISNVDKDLGKVEQWGRDAVIIFLIWCLAWYKLGNMLFGLEFDPACQPDV